MANISRRWFLKRAVGTGMAGFAALNGMGCASFSPISAGLGEGAYGPLERAGPDLKLPPGFQYTKFSPAGAIMSDGYPVPLAHDGMAAFPMENGNVRQLIEISIDDGESWQATFDAVYKRRTIPPPNRG